MQRNISQTGASAELEPDAIASAATGLGLQLGARQAEALARFAGLLLRWNSVHNLTAIDSPADVLTLHLLDSLAIVPHVQRLAGERLARVLDVGAGGGLPGIPLAVAAPHLHVTLIDKVQKKVAFLTQAKVELGLHNVECVHARAEALRPTLRFDVIVARAFASLAELVSVSRHLLAEHGWWCVMKGGLPHDEVTAVESSAPDVRVIDIIRLHVPHLNAKRHLVLMQAAGK